MTEPDPREALRAAHEAMAARPSRETYRAWAQAAWRVVTERHLADHIGDADAGGGRGEGGS